MKFNYQDSSNKPGIYKIFNAHTNRIYIGQASRFERRWHDHKRHLLDGRHQNKFLLNDFNKCKLELGNDDFLEFSIVEVMENSLKEERNKREEEIILQYYDKQESCYNFKIKTEAKERSCYSNTPEETSKLISENSKRQWQNPEHKEFMKAMAKKTWEEASEEKKEKMLSNLTYKPTSGITPEQFIANREENRIKGNLALKEKWATDKEYREKVSRLAKEQYERNKLKDFQVRAKLYYGFIESPTGEIHEVFKLKDFCEKFDLKPDYLRRIFNKTRLTYKGWRLPRIS